MKTIQSSFFVLLFAVFALPIAGFAQESTTDEVRFEVKKIFPPLSITTNILAEAKTLLDLNPYYKPTWVREYISVEISASNNSKTKKVVSENDVISQAQKELMQTVDVGTEISVLVHYIPENNLVKNEAKVWDFRFLVNPENEAQYIGGEEKLRQYLQANAIDKIADAGFDKSVLAAVKFTVDTDGKVVNTHVFETARNEDIDEIFLAAINGMPNWKPAEYANGTKAAQEFVFTVGNMESCVMNLLNIR